MERRRLGRAMRSRWMEWLLVAALLCGMGWQLWRGATADGVTFDEPIHILSGYATLTDHHILFDPEHPPLIKALAALPLLWMDVEMPAGSTDLPAEMVDLDISTYEQANGWGWDLLFSAGNDPYDILLASRLMMIGLTLVTAVVLWRWSRHLFGRLAGLLSLFLFSIDPTVLAHGHYANTDLGGTLGFILSMASLWRFLERRNWRWLVMTGLAMGIALLSKFSMIVLLGLVPMLGLAWLIYHRHELEGLRGSILDSRLSILGPLSRLIQSRTDNLQQATHSKSESAVSDENRQSKTKSSSLAIWASYVLAGALIILIAVGLVWLVYGAMWVVNPEQNILWALGGMYVAWVWGFLPGMYAKGISVIGGERSGYLMGMCYKGSRLEFFPVLTFFKMPVATLLLSSFGAVSWLLSTGRKFTLNKWPFVVWFMVIAIGVYYGISAFAGVNIGVRHVLPPYALLIMVAGWTGAWIWHWAGSTKRQASSVKIGVRMGLVVLLASALWSSWSSSPYFLSYYNELSGEPRNRPWVSDDSSTDWGEGTLALAEFVEEQGIEEIAFSNFVGWTEAQHLGIPIVSANPENREYKGWLAISRSSATYHYCRRDNDWGWVVDEVEPVAVVGGAVNVYYIR